MAAGILLIRLKSRRAVVYREAHGSTSPAHGEF
jgi:hypothetical protein